MRLFWICLVVCSIVCVLFLVFCYLDLGIEFVMMLVVVCMYRLLLWIRFVWIVIVRFILFENDR